MAEVTKMPPAHSDALLAAIISKLPAPGAPWPGEQRVIWLRLLVRAMDLCYRQAPSIRVEMDECDDPPVRGDALGTHVPPGAPPKSEQPQVDVRAMVTDAASAAPALQEEPFIIDRDGFAMRGVFPLAWQDVPPGALIFDDRVGLDADDWESIMWKTVGVVKGGAPRPAGVVLRPGRPAQSQGGAA